MTIRCAMVGLGNLGFPIALTIRQAGFEVMGFDLDERKLGRSAHPVTEVGLLGSDFDYHLRNHDIKYGSLEQVVAFADLIFVCVQTPHDPEYEGITPMPDLRKDFDYTYLTKSLADICEAIENTRDHKVAPDMKPRTIVVISTVLPGTTRNLIRTIGGLPANTELVYNPSLCAMGTVMRDYLNPELVMLGVADPYAERDSIGLGMVHEFYSQLFARTSPHPRTLVMSYESAELAKVSYNTYISAKLAIVNVLGEICDKIPGANVDEVSTVLENATRRVAGPAYLRAGLGDGGACHPRDCIAMSWLAQRLNLHYDIFEMVMRAREAHAQRLAELCAHYRNTDLEFVLVLGYAYKPEVNLTTGSHALLIVEALKAMGVQHTCWDPQFDGEDRLGTLLESHRIVLLGCRDLRFRTYKYAPRAVVIDPFRILRRSDLHRSCKLISFGIGDTP